jgi:hypothetical protein
VTWRGITNPHNDLDALVEGFFKDQKTGAAEGRRARMEGRPWVVGPGVPADHDGHLFDWLTEMLNYGPPDGPEQAWPIILELIRRAPDEETLTYIGSEALEDLVNNAGDRFTDRIAAEAIDDRFRASVRHVWFHPDVPKSIRELVLAAREDVGWMAPPHGDL